MIGQYHAYRQRGISSRRLVTILMVWCDGMRRQEERPRIRTNQKQGNGRTRMSPFAAGLLLGAVAAGGIVARLQKTKRGAKQSIFSWPALSMNERA